MPRNSSKLFWTVAFVVVAFAIVLVTSSVLFPSSPASGPVPTWVQIVALQDGDKQSHWYVLRGKHTVVEDIDLGSRFYVTGWLGKEGDKFMLEPEPRRGAANTSTRLMP